MITLHVWVAILMVVIVAVAAGSVGWMMGYTRGNARYR